MVDNAAGWIGAQGQLPEMPTIQSELPNVLKTFAERQRKEDEKKQKEQENVDAIYGNIVKDMTTVNKPMLQGRKEEVEKRAVDVISKMLGKRSLDKGWNPIADKETLEEVIKLKGDINTYNQEWVNWNQDADYIRNHKLVSRWISDDIGNLNTKTAEELKKVLHEGNVYSSGAGVKNFYKHFATQDALFKNAPEYEVQRIGSNGRVYTEKVKGWADEIPKTKENASKWTLEFLQSGTEPAMGFLEIAQEKVLKEHPLWIMQPTLLQKGTVEEAQKSIMDMLENRKVADKESYGRVGYHSGGAGLSSFPEGTYSKGEVTGAAMAQEMLAKQWRASEEAKLRKRATGVVERKIQELQNSNKEEDRAWAARMKSGANKKAAIDKLVQEPIGKIGSPSFDISNDNVIDYRAVSADKGSLAKGSWKGTIQQIFVDPETGNISAVKAYGKDTSDKDAALEPKVYLADSDIIGQVSTSATYLSNFYRDKFGGELNFNVTKGQKMKGGESVVSGKEAKEEAKKIDMKKVSTIKTKADYEKLPSGALWRKESDPEGVVRKKP